jgi:membrane protein CcdC involved in cytochrome C biogenesis
MDELSNCIQSKEQAGLFVLALCCCIVPCRVASCRVAWCCVVT